MEYRAEQLKVAVVDDEVLWQEKATAIIEDLYGLDVPKIHSYAGGRELLEARAFYDLLFMDVEMQEMDGFAVAKRYLELFPTAKIAMLTSHTELSRRGYVVNAFRYIDKTCMETEIPEALAAVKKAKEKERMIQVNEVGAGRMPILIKDILYVSMHRRNILIHTRQRDIISSLKMQDMEAELEEFGFFRTHRSYLINLDEVLSYEGMNILMSDGTKAYLSTDRSSRFKEKFLERKFEMANG